jgi:hypothetical protein
MKLAEKCCGIMLADARGGILRQRKKIRQYQGEKQEARTGGRFETRFGIEVMEIFFYWTERNRQAE